jgi:hypothetical protein
VRRVGRNCRSRISKSSGNAENHRTSAECMSRAKPCARRMEVIEFSVKDSNKASTLTD